SPADGAVRVAERGVDFPAGLPARRAADAHLPRADTARGPRLAYRSRVLLVGHDRQPTVRQPGPRAEKRRPDADRAGSAACLLYPEAGSRPCIETPQPRGSRPPATDWKCPESPQAPAQPQRAAPCPPRDPPPLASAAGCSPSGLRSPV